MFFIPEYYKPVTEWIYLYIATYLQNIIWKGNNIYFVFGEGFENVEANNSTEVNYKTNNRINYRYP